METVKAIEDDEVDLPDPRLDPSRTNIIRARKIVIGGSVTLHGQSIALYASEVAFQNGGSIDTSGAAPDRDYTNSQPFDGAAPGQNGRDGDQGSQGKNGGTIRIWAERVTGSLSLRSAGGQGGRGRDGGKGHDGEHGTNASSDIVIATSHVGGPGGNGGDGGAAGPSGDGGSGGNIDIAITDAAAFQATQGALSTLESAAAGGSGGTAARGGAAGNGGGGGTGGPYGHQVPLIDAPPFNVIQIPVQDGVSPTAASGKDGVPKPDGKPGQPGANGSVQIRQVQFKDFALASTASHVTMLLNTGEAVYRNANFSAAAEVLGYVYRLAGQRAGG